MKPWVALQLYCTSNQLPAPRFKIWKTDDRRFRALGRLIDIHGHRHKAVGRPTKSPNSAIHSVSHDLLKILEQEGVELPRQRTEGDSQSAGR